ncbi:MAG: LAGLIDADG family homing endonuclease [Candidatus Aenigmatarchaeota archaeon]
MKGFGAKKFADKKKLRSLIKLAKSNKFSAPQLALVFDCGRNTILGTLHNQGMKLQNMGRFKRKFCCNENCFLNLNPASAYWAGFIAADGSLSERDKSLSIGLMNSDKSHLRKFLESINSNSKIHYTKSNDNALKSLSLLL